MRRRALAPVLVRLGLAVVMVACALRVALGVRPGETLVDERHAAGEVARLNDYIDYGLWYGCLFTAIAAALLLATSWCWLKTTLAKPVSLVHSEVGAVPRRRFWLVLAGLLLLALVLRLPRMGQSFWGDEDWAYRDLIGGRFKEDMQDGSLRFRRHSWAVSAFWDKGTNNQYAYTLLARVCHDGWKRLSRGQPEAFSEAALRLPSLAAGLGSIVMGALLLRRFGYSRAALVLASLMAIHPWHVRYSSEARGYTMLIFFLLAGIYFLLAALEDGRWRWWVLFALFEFLSLYTWKAAVHPIVALNLAVFVVLLVKRRTELEQFWRWLVVNVAVLMLFVPLFAPAIPQIRRKLAVSEQARGEMGMGWLQDVVSQLEAGADWGVLGWWAAVLAGIAAVFVILGWVRIRALPASVLIVAPLLGAVLAFLHFRLSGNELLKWYVFYTLPFLLIFLALGMEWRRPFGAGFLVLYVGVVFGVLQDRILSPIQQSREAAAVTRTADEGLLHMGPTDIVTVGLYRASQSYDPRMRQSRQLRSGDALMKVVEECRNSGKALRVSAANLGFARREHADFFALLNDPAVFRKTGDLPAAERYLDIETYEMVAGAP
ncbi:MAG: glycosyltransferase family 39 protein [Verrucomicrobiales bacterium]